jgi:pimeloyl-ACP methyl ester carboxylesterase
MVGRRRSRPGFPRISVSHGASTRPVARSPTAPDVATLAERLGLERLYVVGWSGGGPHALACAALLPELVASAATLAGVAPYAAEGLDWLDGMAEENRDEFGAAIEARPPQGFPEQAADDVREAGSTVADALGGFVEADPAP